MLGAKPCDGLASHLGGIRYTPSRFFLQKSEIRADEPLVSYAGLTFPESKPYANDITIKHDENLREKSEMDGRSRGSSVL